MLNYVVCAPTSHGLNRQTLRSWGPRGGVYGGGGISPNPLYPKIFGFEPSYTQRCRIIIYKLHTHTLQWQWKLIVT